MNKIYLIMIGWDEECHNEGYCTSKEEAQKFCAVNNIGSLDSSYQYRYEEIKCLDGKTTNDERLGVTVAVTYSPKHDQWKSHISTPVIGCKHDPEIIHGIYENYTIRVWQKKFDRQAAKKIADDCFYRRLSEDQKNGAKRLEKLEKYLLNGE